MIKKEISAEDIEDYDHRRDNPLAKSWYTKISIFDNDIMESFITHYNSKVRLWKDIKGTKNDHLVITRKYNKEL